MDEGDVESREGVEETGMTLEEALRQMEARAYEMMDLVRRATREGWPRHEVEKRLFESMVASHRMVRDAYARALMKQPGRRPNHVGDSGASVAEGRGTSEGDGGAD